MAEYGLHSDFDLELHKKNFVNYLEVLIRPSGEIVYAVPSHQEKAAALACECYGLTRKELDALCPREYYGDYLVWLLKISGSISVWDDFCIAPKVTNRQIAALRRLKMAGVYKGAIPMIPGRKEEK
ncbi:MAG: hypothetical protein E7449_01135 [Ruminococcaceae bacterium]|nr:hypothetical protein [Oscillospiraceae bacterium]